MRKGNVDLITLVVGIVPMILFMVLSIYLLTETPIKTDLEAQLTFEESKFESLMALNHVLVYNDNLEQINSYSEFPSDPNAVESTIEGNIDESTQYLTDALLERSFMVNVTMPEEDDIWVKTSNTEGVFISSETNVASPNPEPVIVKVVLDRG